jgi:hypothetical protein
MVGGVGEFELSKENVGIVCLAMMMMSGWTFH